MTGSHEDAALTFLLLQVFVDKGKTIKRPSYRELHLCLMPASDRMPINSMRAMDS